MSLSTEWNAGYRLTRRPLVCLLVALGGLGYATSRAIAGEWTWMFIDTASAVAWLRWPLWTSPWRRARP